MLKRTIIEEERVGSRGREGGDGGVGKGRSTTNIRKRTVKIYYKSERVLMSHCYYGHYVSSFYTTTIDAIRTATSPLWLVYVELHPSYGCCESCYTYTYALDAMSTAT